MWWQLIAALGCGLLGVLSQSPISIPWVLFIAIPILFVLWSRTATSRQAFGVGWVAGVGYFGGSLHWIVEPFLVDAATFGWMIPFALLGMSTGLALFWGAGFWLARRISVGGWGASLVFSASWLAFEWLRGNILTGFPWGLIGYAWIDTPIMQSAAWIGIYGVTLGTVLAGSMLGAAILAKRISQQVFSIGSTIALVGLCWVGGTVSLSGAANADATKLLVGLVQPNVAQKDKWQPHLRDVQLADLLKKTRELSDRGADVVIWPEASSPYPVEQSVRLRSMIAEKLKPNGILLAGGLRFENGGKPEHRVFNSLIAVDKNAEVLSTYDKRHLVPFGEYLPFDETLTRIGLRAMVTLPGGMSAGDETGRILKVAGLPPFTAMICYEAIFPAEAMPRNSDAEWLVQVTNDAWFGQLAGPYQHLVQARVRAIERGLPLVRAANTGVSAIVDSEGRVLSSLPLNHAGVLLGRLPRPGRQTIYNQFEDAPFGLLVAAFLLLGWFGCRQRTGIT